MSQERSQISHRPTGIVNTCIDIRNFNMEGVLWSLELLQLEMHLQQQNPPPQQQQNQHQQLLVTEENVLMGGYTLMENVISFTLQVQKISLNRYYSS